MKKIVWTDFDLDGAGAYLVLKWGTNEDFEVKVTSHRKFRSDFSTWMYHTDLNQYSDIYILDIDCSEHHDVCDIPLVTIIDHHEKHAQNKGVYIHAKTYIEPYTSCTKLLLKYFSQKGIKFSTPQLHLIALVDDYDCYNLRFEDSLKLNTVFWSYTGNKLLQFINDFDSGFVEFNQFHNNILAIHDKKYADVIKNLEIFVADVPRGNNNYKFACAFCDYAINEVAQYIIQKTQSDVGIIINPNNNIVNIRCKKNCDYPIASFAQQICDGDGTSYAAGGKLTEKFASFSRRFKPYVE